MRPALRAISILAGIVALGCLVKAFETGFPPAFRWLVAFAAAACAGLVFEAGTELLSVLYQIRDRLPPPKDA